MSQNILDQIPPTILQSIRRHLEVIHGFNTEVRRARDLERMVGSPGRYEWEFRLAREPQAQASTAWLAQCATQAATRGIDAQTVYATLSTTPTLLPWSDAAQAWRIR